MGTTPTLCDILTPFPTEHFEFVQGNIYIDSRRIRLRLNEDTDGGWSTENTRYDQGEIREKKSTDTETGEVTVDEYCWVTCDLDVVIPGLGRHPGTGGKRWMISSGEDLAHVKRAAKSSAIRDAAGEFGYFAHLYSDVSSDIWVAWLSTITEPAVVKDADWLLDDWFAFLDAKDRGGRYLASDYRKLWLGSNFDGRGEIRRVAKALNTCARVHEIPTEPNGDEKGLPGLMRIRQKFGW